MEGYSLDDLGRVVLRLRREKGLTQEALGAAAGYGRGAGVSISRLENGRLEPTDKFEGIARALGLTTQELEARAAEESSAHGGKSGDRTLTHEERIAAIVRASERRKQLAAELNAFQETSKRAEATFLTRFREITSRVSDAPAPHVRDVVPSKGAFASEAEAEASYQIQFTEYGVSQALADPAGGAAGGEASGGVGATFPFTQAVALGAASLGSKVPRMVRASAALNGLDKALGVRRGTAAGGVGLLTAAAIGVVAATILERQAAVKGERRRRESSAKLAEAEAEIAEHQPNVEALLEVIPRATALLDYIAVHASHALERWGHQIGEGPVNWKTLGDEEQQRYQDFVTIAAAHLALATIDLQPLAHTGGIELEHAKAVADQVLIQAKRAITSRV